MKKTIEGVCPACGNSIFLPIEDVYNGNVIRCPSCSARLTIVDENPVDFEEIFDGEDDEETDF